MRTAIKAFLILVCLGTLLSARESAFSLPTLDRSAKALASGEAGAFLVGLDSLGTNPAGVSGSHREWNATYRQMPLETSLNGMAASVPLPSLQTTVAMSYTALRSVGLERRNAAGERAGEFRHEDQMMGLHVARSFFVGEGELSAGASVKGIQSRIDRYSGTGLAVDLGLRHRLPKVPLTLAATALNVGQGPKLFSERSPLPTSFGMAASYRALPPLAVFGGASYQSGQDILNVSLGAEYRMGNILAFRGNYTAGTGAEGKSGLGQLVGGIGVFLGKFRLDYAFQPAGEELSQAGAPATQHATLTLDF